MGVSQEWVEHVYEVPEGQTDMPVHSATPVRLTVSGYQETAWRLPPDWAAAPAHAIRDEPKEGERSSCRQAAKLMLKSALPVRTSNESPPCLALALAFHAKQAPGEPMQQP
jgi:hypothetical protein